MNRLLLVLLLLPIGSAALGSDTDEPSAAGVHPGAASTAEYVRLSDEMRNLARRQAWSGVERAYSQLERLGVQIQVDDLLNGALAARELGMVQQAYDRLSAAARLQPSREIVDWLWDIDANYGRVTLVGDGTDTVVLTIEEFPFDPAQARAVETAIEQVGELGTFSGALPAGIYTFGDRTFEVRAGSETTVELPCRKRCKGGRREDGGTR